MNKKILKYFWGLNEKALKEAENVLKNIEHPKFAEKLTTLLSRCDRPEELFSFISKKDFIASWPRVRTYWKKIHAGTDFRDWWQTIYEQLVLTNQGKDIRPKGKVPASFIKIGEAVRSSRINKGLSQNDLALMTDMKQPDICAIERGKKNITLTTLISLCHVLGIKHIVIPT